MEVQSEKRTHSLNPAGNVVKNRGKAMKDIGFPPLMDNLCNCSYTSTSAGDVKVDIAALIKIMQDIPEVPRVYKMDIDLKPSPFLLKNTIVISSDIADAIEEAIQ
jgi:hypothetical protein